MADTVRVLLEEGKKKSAASAFDWPGWERGAKSAADAVAVLDVYRPRYAVIAKLAGLEDAFSRTGKVKIVERAEGSGMTNYYGVSMKSAASEHEQMTEAECERKLALLQAAWKYFDDVAARVSPQLRLGPRGGGRDREAISRHVNGAEIYEFAKKVGLNTPLEARENPKEVSAHRKALCAAIRDYNSRGVSARTWTVQFVLRRCAYHMLDHAWEMEDRDLTDAS